MLMCLYTEI